VPVLHPHPAPLSFPCAGPASGLVLCSAHQDQLRERFTAAIKHGDDFQRVLSMCLAIIQDRADSGVSHLVDIVAMLNFNEFHTEGAGRARR
jgi:hypothetical protein